MLAKATESQNAVAARQSMQPERRALANYKTDTCQKRLKLSHQAAKAGRPARQAARATLHETG